MYELARNKMSARQEKVANYFDKKVIDDPLAIGDKVYIYLPRNKRLKLVPNWYGPVLVIFENHPVYRVTIATDQGDIEKTVTRDRLKRVKNSDVLLAVIKSSCKMNIETQNEVENDLLNNDSSDSEIEDNLDEPYVDRLRPRPRVAPDRFFEIHATKIQMLF